MYCVWEPFEDKFRCKECGFVYKNDKLNKQCHGKSSPQPPPQPPNILKRAVNFAGAAIKHVAAGLPQCTDDEVKERYDICTKNECGFFNKEWSVCAHTKCGCFIRERGIFMDKLRWADSECPVGQWKSIKRDQNGV